MSTDEDKKSGKGWLWGTCGIITIIVGIFMNATGGFLGNHPRDVWNFVCHPVSYFNNTQITQNSQNIHITQINQINQPPAPATQIPEAPVSNQASSAHPGEPSMAGRTDEAHPANQPTTALATSDDSGTPRLEVSGDLTQPERDYIRKLVEPRIASADKAVVTLQVLSITKETETVAGQTGARVNVSGLCAAKNSAGGPNTLSEPITVQSDVEFVSRGREAAIGERLRRTALDKFIEASVQAISKHP